MNIPKFEDSVSAKKSGWHDSFNKRKSKCNMKIYFSIIKPANKYVYYRISFFGIEFINSFQIMALNIVFFNLQLQLLIHKL